MIDAASLAFRYPDGTFTLAIERFDVDAGEAVAVIGPSGCGKTTLMHLIAGILVSRTGEITVKGEAVHAMSDAQRRLFRIRNVGLVFQDFVLLDYLSVRDNIVHPYRINHALALDGEVKARARELAEAVGIGDRLDSRVEHMSYGEQQRAAICRALLTRPAVVLADEPTGNLDPENKQGIVDILLGYAREHDAALVVATHDHALLGAFDRVYDFRDWTS
jgi:putative ABC transport system ATP-binding protein